MEWEEVRLSESTSTLQVGRNLNWVLKDPEVFVRQNGYILCRGGEVWNDVLHLRNQVHQSGWWGCPCGFCGTLDGGRRQGVTSQGSRKALVRCLHLILRPGAANVSCKGPDSQHFWFCSPCKSLSQWSAVPLWLESSCRQWVNHWAWPWSRETLFMDAKIWISYDFQCRKILFFDIFSQPFKNVKKPFLAHLLYKNRQLAGSLPTPDLYYKMF